MRPILTAMLIVLTSLPAAAKGPDRISFLAGSKHINPGSDFNEFNPGVFLSWGESDSFSVGTYHNSYGRQSVAATYTWDIAGNDFIDVGLFAGAALYPEDGRRFAIHLGDVVPFGGLQLRVGHVFANVIPGDGKEVDGIIGFGLTFRTDELFRR